MKTTKLLIALGCLALLLNGCATLGLPDNPTADQLRQAQCQDAMVGRAMAQVALADASTNPPAQVWWTKYLAAVDVLIMSYCPGTPVETVVVVK